ncbi:MAG: UPF0182 family protein, partial [Dehalococcoidia bacterium]|nr:UPF0182 family protein [Dehalococcoidia bacterium]
MGFGNQPSEEGDELGPPPGPFRFRQRPRFRLPGGLLRWGAALVPLLLLFFVLSVVKGIYADWLWFDSVEGASGTDYLSVFRLRITTRIWLFFAGAGIFLLFFGSNVLGALWVQSRSGVRFELPLGDVANVRRIVLVVGVAAALFLAVIFGTQAAGQWDNVLLYMNSESFGVEDPAFGKDIGFYVFRLPLLNFILGWSLAVVVLTTVIVAGFYAFRLLVSGFSGTTPPLARPHVSLLLVVVVALFVWRYWLGRFGLVYSERGAAFGAGYADINAQLPVTYVLMGFGALTALLILVSAFRRGLVALPVGAAVLWAAAAIVGGLIYPATVQRFQVEPNELAVERPYLRNHLEATRAAFGLDEAELRTFTGEQELTREVFEEDEATVNNLRLW